MYPIVNNANIFHYAKRMFRHRSCDKDVGKMLANIGNTKDCWLYRPNFYSPPQQAIDKTAKVLIFRDERKKVTSNTLWNTHGCFIPGVLTCTVENEPLMMIQQEFNLNPQEDFAKALAEELQAANFFRETSYNVTADNSDYIVNGTILEATAKYTMYSYGLGFIGPIALWLVLPAGSLSNNLSVEITCTEAKTGGLVLSKADTAPENYRTIWLYTDPNKCDFGKMNTEMMQAIYKQFVVELRATLTSDKK